jgi:hypothetical protein
MKQPKREFKSKEEYQPTAEEIAARANFIRKRGRSIAPGLKVDGTASVSIDHPDIGCGQLLLMEALATVDHDFFLDLLDLLDQLSNGSWRGGKVDERLLNFMVAVVKGVKPRDQVEIMLATQMAAIHDAFIRATKILANAKTIPQQDSAERLRNKLARTFAIQMEALQRYRSGGERKVTVQQVSVNDGGRAIVGNVTQAQREPRREPPAKMAVIPFAARPSMAVIDRVGEREPIPIERIGKAQKTPSKE